MFLIMVLGDFVVQIPMPVLVGIMISVSISTFDWSSFKYIVKTPRTDAIVMLATVTIVVLTNDLSKGVLVGVLLSAIFFVIKISSVKIIQEGNRYIVHGQLFFASIDNFVDYFKTAYINEKNIQIDLSQTRIWDDSSVGALMKVTELLNERGIEVELIEMDPSSKKIVDQLNTLYSSN